MRLEEILDMLGNETRREILQLLSERPCYVSQVSQELNVGQKAIIEHLKLMRRAGILDSTVRKIEKGRPRKYYGISQEVILEVKIGQTSFDIADISPALDQELLESLPKLKRITEKIERSAQLRGKEKIMELEDVYNELLEERENLDTAKKVVEYFLGQIREEIRNENLEKEIEGLLF
ncbi:MAG: ArsR family transcriptional regulator [Candidatus Hydrothermarchaeota archaeon]|jgi:ArsR family transcriptional regulator|nr:ArsR family transcriptional regulator [Candidatus Hydrothermarchaeota archaeon]